jgi:7-keto-8-aminopelargonate synthetase-like enzyme
VIEPEPLQQVERTYVLFRGRKLSYFSGCDYFRLSSHKQVQAALTTGLKQYGLNVAASRLTSGNHRLYAELERALARFFGAEDALVVSSGYMTNLVVAQALARNFSHALIDEKSHGSLKDASGFLEIPVVQFKHRDPADLERAVKRCGPGCKLVLLTDGMFSQDGSVAPLRQYLDILPADALMLVDDAHGAGVLGQRGQGSPEHSGVRRRQVIQTITLSKAFGVYGGAILGPASLRKRILTRSRMFASSTPLPLPLANAALRSIQLLAGNKSFQVRLLDNAEYLRNELKAAEVILSEAPGPILALYPKHAKEVPRLRAALLAAGIFPPFIRYPGGPPAGYFRFVISSEHSRLQLMALVQVLKLQTNSSSRRAFPVFVSTSNRGYPNFHSPGDPAGQD